MTCPYCGSPMHRGELAFAFGHWNAELIWMPDRRPPGGIWSAIKARLPGGDKRCIIEPGFLRRGRRFANYCGYCEAITIDPATPEAIVIRKDRPADEPASGQPGGR
jgi:hypothetical protein